MNNFIGLKDDSTIVVSLPDSIETLTLLKTVKIEGAAPEPGQRLGSLIILAAIIEIFYRNTPSDSIIHNKTVSTIHSLVGSSTGKAQYSIALVLFQHILGKSIRRGQGTAGEKALAGLFMGAVLGVADMMMTALKNKEFDIPEGSELLKRAGEIYSAITKEKLCDLVRKAEGALSLRHAISQDTVIEYAEAIQNLVCGHPELDSTEMGKAAGRLTVSLPFARKILTAANALSQTKNPESLIANSKDRFRILSLEMADWKKFKKSSKMAVSAGFTDEANVPLSGNLVYGRNLGRPCYHSAGYTCSLSGRPPFCP